MSARFEIVRGSFAQPWHARLVSNGRVLMSSETYARKIGAERAVLSMLRALGFEDIITLAWNVEGVEKVFLYPDGGVVPHMPTVRYIDERATS